MPTYGFSAFLKLLCLNERPMRTELRRRLLSTGGGYDFHRSLRLRASRYLVGGEPIADVLASVAEIARPPERASAQAGLERLHDWRLAHLGTPIQYPAATYESPASLFRVNFMPDFGLELAGRGVAIHVWNTARPRLIPRMVYAALSIVSPVYEGVDGAPEDLAVLSLPDSTLLRLSEAGRLSGIGPSTAERVEDLIRDVQYEIDHPEERDRPHGAAGRT